MAAAILTLALIQQQQEMQEESLRRWWNAPAKAKGTAFAYKAVEHIRRDYDYFMRMTPDQFDRILRLILTEIAPKGTRQLPEAKQRLAIVLKYLVSGDSLSSLSFYSGVSPRDLRSYVKLVCEAIWKRLMPMVLPFPKEETWKKAAEEINLKWQFPNCPGAIDIKNVAMQAPADEGCQYLNHKGSHSVALLAICDANCKFLFVEIGDTCRKSDEHIYKDSKFVRALEEGKLNLPSPSAIIPGMQNLCLLRKMTYVFAGDAAFPLTLNLMKPFRGKNLTYEERIFNYRFSRVQCLIEYAFSIMSSRYRVFERPISAKADMVISIVRAAVVLHNFLIDSEKVVIPDRR